MNETIIGGIGVLILVGLFVTGMEIAFAMAIIGVVGYAVIVSPSAALSLLANDFCESIESYGLTVIPLFVLMGQIAFNAGIARRLYDSVHRFFGHVPGGLAIATVVAATVFKAICGSTAATVATFASVAVPEMNRYNYSSKLSTGIVATIGALGALIPPSVTLIVIGLITEQSIGKLFMAGLIPGLFLSVSFICVILVWARINPQIGPGSDTEYSWKEKMASLGEIIWPVIIFVVIIGGMMKGFFTPTEAGSVGAFAVFLLCWVKGDIKFAGLVLSIQQALRTSCMVLIIVAFSTVLGHFIAVTNIPQDMAEWVVTLPIHRHFIILIILILYLVGGSFVDDLPFLIIATPLFFPAILNLGYNAIWVCIMVCLTFCIGQVIPPVAMCAFIVRNITKVPLGIVYSGIYPFLISLVLAMVLMFIFPEVVLYLPSVFMK